MNRWLILCVKKNYPHTKQTDDLEDTVDYEFQYTPGRTHEVKLLKEGENDRRITGVGGEFKHQTHLDGGIDVANEEEARQPADGAGDDGEGVSHDDHPHEVQDGTGRRD